jgi:hypothetical protein
MAVICFCLRPLVLPAPSVSGNEREGRTQKRSAPIRQLGSYI